uniref:Uncharacterized protein n=1 Tax=Aegilops tauschii subsp. strangulata TaxID=200361 RepID=A0A453S3S0_AEGTS
MMVVWDKNVHQCTWGDFTQEVRFEYFLEASWLCLGCQSSSLKACPLSMQIHQCSYSILQETLLSHSNLMFYELMRMQGNHSAAASDLLEAIKGSFVVL